MGDGGPLTFGRTADNFVWEDCGDVVMVCGERQFERLRDGYPAPMPIGFKRADVAPAVCPVSARMAA